MECGESDIGFLTIPTEIQLKVISYMSYDEISKLRLVCREFNQICMGKLNSGFSIAESIHAQTQKEVRSKLPRRESERRTHELSRHADILSAIETRMSLLQITYAKYIESGYCCFIPGKVLDELYRVLRYVKSAKNPPRSHEVLMELRDISSMAMEHFEEKVLPTLKRRLLEDGVAVLPGGLTVGLDNDMATGIRKRDMKRPAMSPLHSPSLSKRVRLSVMSGSPGYGGRIVPYPGGGIDRYSPLSPYNPYSHPLAPPPLYNSYMRLSDRQEPRQPTNSTILDRLAETERIITAQGEKIEEQDRCMKDMARKLTEYNNRFNDLAEVIRSGYQSSGLQEKITALIQPVREKKIAKRTQAKNVSEESQPSTSTQMIEQPAADKNKSGVSGKNEPLIISLESSSDSLADNVIPRISGGIGDKELRLGSSLTSPYKRSEILKENMDMLRDECGLDEFEDNLDVDV